MVTLDVKRIRELMWQKALDNQSLARLMGICEQQLKRVLGRGWGPLDWALQLAGTLCVEIEEITAELEEIKPRRRRRKAG